MTTKTSQSPPLPRWDAVRRQLWVGRVLVKAFTGPAANQELLLTCFHESGWDTRPQDDPLPPKADLPPRKRFQAAVEGVKGCQRTQLLRFRLCQSSTAVYWEWFLPAAAVCKLVAAAARE